MIILIIVVIYLLIAFGCYKLIKWNHKEWEKIALSLSWPCIAILYGIRKVQEAFQKEC